MDRNEGEENRPSSIYSCVADLERMGRMMQQSLGKITEWVNEMNPAFSSSRDSSEARALAEQVERLSLMLPDPQQRMFPRPIPSPRQSSETKELEKPSRRGRFWTFAMINPLGMMTKCDTVWESPIVPLFGEHGYRGGLRVHMSGKGSLKGQAISVRFFLSPGPYDDWLEWPFPCKSVSVAMFRTNGKKPYVLSFAIPAFEKHGTRETDYVKFLSINNFFEDKNFVKKRQRPDGEDDVLLLGLAVDGDDTCNCEARSFLEPRIERLERSMQKLEADVDAWNGVLARQPRRDQYGDHYCC